MPSTGRAISNVLGRSKGVAPAVGAIGAALLLDDLLGPTISRVGGSIADKIIPKAQVHITEDVKRIFERPEVKKYFESLVKTDPILAQADKKLLEEAFLTILQVGPTVAKIPTAVKTILREVALYNAPIGYATIEKIIKMENDLVSRGTQKLSSYDPFYILDKLSGIGAFK